MSTPTTHPVPSQIDYKHVEPSATPKYRFLRIPLNNLTGSSFQIGPTTSQVMEFKLPNTVYNLAQSYLSYQVYLPAPAANTVNWIPEDTLEIASNAYFGSAGGMDLCNLNFVNRYTKIARKMKTRLSDFLAKDITSQLYPCNSTAGQGTPAPQRQGAAANPVAGANPIAYTGGFVASQPGFYTSITNFTEPRYLQNGAVAAEGTSTRMFNLGGIKDTIFSVDKDLYIPQDMYIRITAGTANQFTWTSTHATNATSDPTVGAAATTAQVTLRNTFLYLAIETNQLIIDSVMNKVLTSGLKLNIPYTTAFRNASTGTVANIQVPMTQQYGRKLKRMLHTVWHATESANTALDCSNTNGAKIQLYNTYLDQRQMQDAQLSTAAPTGTAINEDDWRENHKYCLGSVIQNRSIYQLNWFHCDSWTQPSEHYFDDDSHEDDGLPMDSPKLWQIQATTQDMNLTHYTFATFVRQVVIDRTGPNFV